LVPDTFSAKVARGGQVATVARKECLAKGEVELRLFLQGEVELRLFLRGNIFSRRGRPSCNCCEEISSREGGGRVAVVSARKHLLAGEGRQLTNKDIHGTFG